MKICPSCQARFGVPGWRCPTCGAERLADGYVRLTEDLPELVDGYSAEEFLRTAEAEAGSFWARNRNALVVWALRTYFPNARNYLEVGCGTGIVLKAVRDALPELEVSAGDPYRPALEVARQIDGVELLQIDARRLPFEDEFDVVGLFDVLEHVGEDDALLAETHRAVRPGGGVVLTVPQHRWLWSAADDWALHHRRYTRPQVLAKLTRAGFTVSRVTSFVSILLPALAIARSPVFGRVRYDPGREFRVVRPVAPLLEAVMGFESRLIRAGVSFPAGGSLLVVACRATRPGYAGRGRARVRARSESVSDRDQRRSARLRLP